MLQTKIPPAESQHTPFPTADETNYKDTKPIYVHFLHVNEVQSIFQDIKVEKIFQTMHKYFIGSPKKRRVYSFGSQRCAILGDQ